MTIVATVILIFLEVIFLLSITESIESELIRNSILFVVGFLTFFALSKKSQPQEKKKQVEISEHKIIKRSDKVIGYYGETKIHEWIEVDDLGIFEFVGTTAINSNTKYQVPEDIQSNYALLEPGILYKPVKENDTATTAN